MKSVYSFPLKSVCASQSLSSDPLVYSDPLKRRIEEIWESGQSTKMLVDHMVLSLISYQDDRLLCRQIPYKTCYAAMCDSVVRQKLSVYPLAVCGRTICDGAILLARRAANLATDGGLFECCPSGGIDSSFLSPDNEVDVRSAIMQEFVEETRLSPDTITAIEPKCLLWTVEHGVFDICFDIHLCPHVMLPQPNAECSEFQWWRPGDSTDEVTESSRFFLQKGSS